MSGPGKPTGGRFEPGRSGNPKGRPRKDRSIAGTVMSAMGERVVVNQDGKRKRVTLSEATAKNAARKGAAGDARTAKMMLELAQKSEERLAATPPSAETLSSSDQTIVERFIARMKRIWQEETSNETDDTR